MTTMLWRGLLCIILLLFVVCINCTLSPGFIEQSVQAAGSSLDVQSDQPPGLGVQPDQAAGLSLDVQTVQAPGPSLDVQPVQAPSPSLDVQLVQAPSLCPDVQLVQAPGISPSVQSVQVLVQSAHPNVQPLKDAGLSSNVQLVQFGDPNVQSLQGADLSSNVQLVQSVDPNVQSVQVAGLGHNVHLVQPVGPSVQNVQTVDLNVQHVDPSGQNVQPVGLNVQPVGPTVQNVQTVGLNVQPGGPSVQNVQPVGLNDQPVGPSVQNVQPVDLNVQPVGPSVQNVQPVDPNVQPVGPSVQNVQPVGLKAKHMAPTDFKGSWELYCPDAGVSAMHLALLPLTSNCIMFDATVLNSSRIKLPPGPCRPMVGTNQFDCDAHSVIFDYENPTIKPKPQRMHFDTWCSSGALDVDGRIVSTGGYMRGSNTVRYHENCRDYCEWEEYPDTLGNGRWYSTQLTLSDGRFMVFGGRDFHTFEFVPPRGEKNTPQMVTNFPFLLETKDPEENNLYPFVYLSTDGNIFVFANHRAVLLDLKTLTVIHNFPELHPGARNYPASASCAMLPITLQTDENRPIIPAEIMICGGAPRDAYFRSERGKMTGKPDFVPCNKDCGIIDITDRNSNWKILMMPMARLFSDAINLPTGDVLLINGAQSGSAGWEDAEDPNYKPLLFRYDAPDDAKFVELAPTDIPRMYHSTSALLPDGKVLVAGSNTHNGYIYNIKYPTDTRVEKFSPHYYDPNLDHFRTDIILEKRDEKINYGERFDVTVSGGGDSVLDMEKLQVVMYQIPFTTHSISMNQRLIRLGIYEVKPAAAGPGTNNIVVQAPPNGNVSPPGYYLMFVVYNGVPCRRGSWLQIK